ncbi:DUF4344 domain-containing metallopeptidase [Streptomyces zaehneri]|uniref:DUF4344 domain-containing metallopeptidase n=1 Tax=Streptomyces zaehneri TaxID=3051180 RepID=UPI0037DA07FF
MLDVAETWRLSAITYEDEDEDEDEDDGQADEHSTDHQRAVAHLCCLYGAAPADHADVIGTDTLPAGRARGCAREWKRAQAAWMNAIERSTEAPGQGPAQAGPGSVLGRRPGITRPAAGSRAITASASRTTSRSPSVKSPNAFRS